VSLGALGGGADASSSGADGGAIGAGTDASSSGADGGAIIVVL